MPDSENRSPRVEYALRLAGLMDLDCWRFIFGPDLPVDEGDTETIARVDVTYGQQSALLRFCPDFDDLPADKQRRSLVHELVHCHLNRLMVSSRNMAHRLGDEARNMAEDLMHDEIEYTTDRIAVAWANLLPLPEPKPEEN